MAGSDRSKGRGWAGPQPVFVLVRPQMGENIGASARAMLNFGLEHMRLVAPRDGWPNPAATATAAGASAVLDKLQVVETLPEALADLDHVYATTARPRELTKPVLEPAEAMREARGRIAAGQKVGVIFGPERSGLENADVARANAIVSVPVNPAFASLNLSQCVLLLAYEWLRQAEAGEEAAPARPASPDAAPAPQVEIERLARTLEERLEAAHFFWPEIRAESMRLNLRNMLSRMPLTRADVRMWHGIVKFLSERWPRD